MNMTLERVVTCCFCAEIGVSEKAIDCIHLKIQSEPSRSLKESRPLHKPVEVALVKGYIRKHEEYNKGVNTVRLGLL